MMPTKTTSASKNCKNSRNNMPNYLTVRNKFVIIYRYVEELQI